MVSLPLRSVARKCYGRLMGSGFVGEGSRISNIGIHNLRRCSCSVFSNHDIQQSTTIAFARPLIQRDLVLSSSLKKTLRGITSSNDNQQDTSFVSQRRRRGRGHDAISTNIKKLYTLKQEDAQSDEDQRSYDAEANASFTIRWMKSDGTYLTFNAVEGELLRTAALRRGIVSPHNGKANLINCRGLGTCGTCAVHISETSSTGTRKHGLPNKNSIEQLRLSVPPGHGGEGSQTYLRLACQIPVTRDLTVTKYKGFWGQHVDLDDSNMIADPSLPTQPLGSAEFILDRTSPPNPLLSEKAKE